MGKVLADHEALVRADLSRQGALQLAPLLLEAALGEWGEGAGISGAGDELLEDGAAACSNHIGSDGGELDVGAFQRLLEAIYLRNAFADERGAVAGELAQFALAAGRDEAAAKEAVLEEVSDPLGRSASTSSPQSSCPSLS